jgi:putative ABC transport system permease protein
MLTLRLALRSLANRKLTTALTIASIALSVALLVGVETVRRGIRESFAGTIRGTDLIVGARGGSQQLLLSSVFGLGAPAGSFSWSTYQRWAAHPAVEWTIPLSLGDSYFGFRVVGTTDAFFEHYRYRNDGRVTLATGALAATDRDVVIGSEVAERRELGVGDEIALTHGLRGSGIMDHEEHPFKVVGILAPTFTPIDRSLYVTLDGIEAMHENFVAGGVPPVLTMPGAAAPSAEPSPSGDGDADQSKDSSVAVGAAPIPYNPGPGVSPASPSPDGEGDAIGDGSADSTERQLSSFLLGTRNRFESLQLQREINTDTSDPLTAILPAVSLTELWHTIGYAEDGARIISFAVLLVGLLGMLVALYSTLQERRREMAILRSLGAGPRRIALLLVIESGVLAALGAVVGMVVTYGALIVGRGIAERHFGIFIPITAPQRLEWIYLAGVVVAGVLVGLVPAWRAYRNALQDGLAIRL